MDDSFQKYHPLVNFTYFAFVLGFTMVINHPLAQMISFASALTYAVQIEGKKAILFALKFCLPLMLLTAFINPAFNHEGITILTYFPTGNPLTLESILYGLSAGCMLGTILIWFTSFNRIITSDKFIYLFGRVIPALSLVLSMTLRFIPKFKYQLNLVVEAQRSLGRDISQGSMWQRAKKAIVILSIMTTWALENAIETADSMKSRGYGLKGRTAFSIYQFRDQDKLLMLWIAFCGSYMLSGYLASGFAFRYFPSIRYSTFNFLTISFYLSYLALCITPVILNSLEERRWKVLYSKM
ncbi:MAG: energy-coupling factor transporter transmembrane protein EcfT [Fastidiosipila sp.]|nr:energy-coupling factor transporter transmembrane protein EcfT [Fastidiosipila sp.]